MPRILHGLFFSFLGLYFMQAQVQDDKALHFSAGAISGAAGALVASEISDNNKFWTFAGSVTASLLAGAIKETIDQRNYNGWDNADLGATVLGGVSAGVTFNIFTGKSKRPRLKQEVFLVRTDLLLDKDQDIGIVFGQDIITK